MKYLTILSSHHRRRHGNSSQMLRNFLTIPTPPKLRMQWPLLVLERSQPAFHLHSIQFSRKSGFPHNLIPLKIHNSPPTPKLTLSGDESSRNRLLRANTSIGGPFSTPSKMLAILTWIWLLSSGLNAQMNFESIEMQKLSLVLATDNKTVRSSSAD